MLAMLAGITWALVGLTVAGSTEGAVQPPINALATTTLSGREIFQFYCASCHGPDGKGDGPVAVTLRTRPPDLTTITRRNGVFPDEALRRSIAGTAPMATSHGTREMPVWGPFFRELRPPDALADVRIENVIRFIESLQKH